jgi:hypothetical protein
MGSLISIHQARRFGCRSVNARTLGEAAPSA